MTTGKEEYKKQMRLSVFNIAGEIPNFTALLISAISTRAVLMFVDMIDTAGNLLRNILIALISVRLRKDLHYRYNYGVGKVEALVSMLCDFLMVLSLGLMMGFAVRDLIYPRPIGGLLLFTVIVKAANLTSDIFIYWKQRKICKSSDNLVFRSALSVATKNLIFDATTLAALLLMQIFGDIPAIWYLSPVVSLVLGGYLLFKTIMRIRETFGIILDRSASENVQVAILQTLTTFYDKYDAIENVRSRVSGGVVFVDLDLGFAPGMTYSEMREIADGFEKALSEKVPNCEVALCIRGEKYAKKCEE